MAEDDTIFDGSLRDLSPKAWANRLSDFIRDQGSWEDISKDHAILRHGSGNRLLVTFEFVDDIIAHRKNALPMGLEYSQIMGWTCLTVLARSRTWFRDPVLYARFDDMVDDGFFEQFESVLFYGSKMGGYGAAAFSVSAPGAYLVAIQPHATLDPRVTEWDRRYTSKRRLDFTSRYGFAPDMVEAAHTASIIYDPDEDMDAMHASLFTRPNVQKLRTRWMGPDVASMLEDADILRPVIAKAIKGRLSRADFAHLYRRRQNCLPYLRNLLTEVEDRGRKDFTAKICRSIVGSGRSGPRIRRKLAALESEGYVSSKTQEA